MISVIKRNGKIEKVDVEKINRSVMRACEGLKEVSASEIVLDTSKQLYNNISTIEIDKALVLSTRTKIEKEPEYSKVAARLQANILNKEVFGESTNAKEFDSHYREAFVRGLNNLVKDGSLNTKLTSEFDIPFLAQSLVIERDDLLKYAGVQILYDRYLLKVDDKVVETIQGFWMRVAMGLCLREKDKNVKAKLFYDKMSELYLCPSTPTLFNSGKVISQLSSCYVSCVGDDIDGIMGTWHDCARLSKHAGGIGVDVTNIRAQGSKIKSTGGKAAGVVPYLKILNDVLLGFDQGGKRKGSGAVYLETFHPEIEEFQELTRNTGDDRRRTHDLHTANWINDLFMKRVDEDGDWLLVCPSEANELHELYGEAFESKYLEYEKLAANGKLKNYKIVKAKDLARKMLNAVSETGHPWWTFKDMCNECYMSKHAGVVHSSQLCVEVVQHTSPTKYNRGQKAELGLTSVCNLASINASKHIKNKQIDKELLRETTFVTINMLDNVIDDNYYPIDEAQKSNHLSRHIGLGMMGFADAVHELDVAFDSNEAEKLSNDLGEVICFNAVDASVELAKERGAYPQFQGSEWSKGKFHHEVWKEVCDKKGFVYKTFDSVIPAHKWDELRSRMLKYGIRNANIIALAPNASNSFIIGASESIAAYFSVMFANTSLSGNLMVVDEYFVKKCKELGIWSEQLVNSIKSVDGDISLLNLPQELKDKFKTAFNIDQKRYIEIAAARAKWVDQSQSLNLFYRGSSKKEIWDIYHHAWSRGLKTTYYFRTEGASRSEKITVTEEVKQCSIEAMKRGEVCESCS